MKSSGSKGSVKARYAKNVPGPQPMSAMPHGSARFISATCYAAASDLTPRSPLCAVTVAFSRDRLLAAAQAKSSCQPWLQRQTPQVPWVTRTGANPPPGVRILVVWP